MCTQHIYSFVGRSMAIYCLPVSIHIHSCFKWNFSFFLKYVVGLYHVFSVSKARFVNGIPVMLRDACDSTSVAGALHIMNGVITLPPRMTLYRHLVTDPQVRIFANTLKRSGLLNHLFLRTANTHTVFAPINEAFNNSFYSPELLNCLNSTGDNALQRLLRFHIAGPAEHLSSLSINRYWVLTTSSDNLRVGANENGTVVLGDDLSVEIISGDIRARNGVMHKIDKVLPVPGLEFVGVCESFAPTSPPPPTTVEPGSGIGSGDHLSPILPGT